MKYVGYRQKSLNIIFSNDVILSLFVMKSLLIIAETVVWCVVLYRVVVRNGAWQLESVSALVRG